MMHVYKKTLTGDAIQYVTSWQHGRRNTATLKTLSLLKVSTLTVVRVGFGRVGCWTTHVTLSSSCRWVGKRRMLLRVEVPFE